MRIDPASLPPGSPLALRIAAAIGRDQAESTRRAAYLAAGDDVSSGATPASEIQVPANGRNFEPESALHDAVVQLLRASALPGTFWTHFPAGEKRSEATGRKLARMGTKPGVPDFVLVVDGRALFLELKTATGKLSAMQKETHTRLIRAGAEVAVVRCVESAADQLRRWGAIAGQST